MPEADNNTPKRKKQQRIPLTKDQRIRAERLVATSLKSNPDIFNLPTSKRTASNLADYFAKIIEGSNRILPREKMRYAVYLRRSTDSEDRQVRSLDDQLDECEKLAKRLGITILKEDVFSERESAKLSGERKLFDRMLLGFESGKYQGLLCYSPDRLSRNMLEAGKIIEMVDLDKIQDLHFSTYSFENSPNGKMMLGILFATSKQYSDKLSQDIGRGIDGNALEGKYNGSVKKGYYAEMPSKHFMPDAHNWQLLRQAFVMRLYEGKTNQEVADFLNDVHFSYRKTQNDKYKIAKMNNKSVGDLFADSFYCGVYKYGDNVTDLSEHYNFLPIITPDEYIALNRNLAESFNEKTVGRKTSSQRLDFGLLREKVICDYCDSIMVFQRTKIKKGKNAGSWLLSFYCRNKSCIRHNDNEAIKKYGKKLARGVRAKYVTAHIEWTLRHLTENVDQAYRQYIERLEQKIAVDTEIAKRKLKDAQGKLRGYRVKYVEYQDFQVKDPDGYKRHHNGKLEDYRSLIDATQASEKSLKTEIDRLKEALPTREQFVELIHSYLIILLDTTDLIEEDTIYQELVLNLRVRDNVVSVIKLNPPYDLMVDLEKVVRGGARRS